jgi:hypothetical protein
MYTPIKSSVLLFKRYGLLQQDFLHVLNNLYAFNFLLDYAVMANIVTVATLILFVYSFSMYFHFSTGSISSPETELICDVHIVYYHVIERL